MITSACQRRPFGRPVSLAAAPAVLILGLLGHRGAAGQPVLYGYRDHAFGSAVSTPTEDKPQSKLWWNDGAWWGCLYNPARSAYCIYALDRASQTWASTDTIVDARASAHMDALWADDHLYIVSGGAKLDGLLYRFSYNSAAHSYALDGGFPVMVRSGGAETITVARDSTGQLWITYPRVNKVWANRSLGSDTAWGKPFQLPVSSNSNASDDISAVVAFRGDRIGIMWSNEVARTMCFAVHLDADPDTTWQATETALPGAGQDPALAWADDHINLKQIATDGTGRVFAAIKTSLGDATNADPASPQVMLLVRDSEGAWSGVTFGTVDEDHTRPVILIDEENAILYMLATAGAGGGAIYYKSCPLSDLRFPVGRGTPLIQSVSDTAINNATSCKQNLNSTTGLAVLAGDSATGYYLHNYLDLSDRMVATLAPVADAYVRNGTYANSNFGTSSALYTRTTTATDSSRDSYLKFDLTAVSNILSARLRLACASVSGGAVPMAAYGVADTSWSETGITWNTRPSLGTALSSATVTGSAYAWYELDITQYIQQQVASGQSLVSLGLHNTAVSGSHIQVWSREAATLNRPQLVITSVAGTPPPGTPENLAATCISSSQIDLSWTDVATNEDGFRVERSDDGTVFREVAVVAPNQTTYSDTGLPSATTFTYRVCSYNAAGGNSSYSNTASTATLPEPPASPTGLTAVAASGTQVDLAWTDNASNEDSFRIERSADGMSYAEVASVAADATSYSDTGLTPVTTYFYRVRAHNAGGWSDYTNVASATTPQAPPAAPSNLAATGVSSSRIDLTWTDNAANEDSFVIQRSADGVTFADIGTVAASSTAYSDTGLDPATTYTYRVCARNSAGDSAFSSTAAGTTLPLPPAAPGGLVATAVSSARIDLVWADNSTNEDSFGVERSTDGITFAEIASVAANTTSYADIGLAGGTTYTYRVRARNAGGGSDYSNTASATTGQAPPESTTLSPAADAFVRDGTGADTNYGTANTLYAHTVNSTNYRRDSYMKFSISGVAGSIVSARLRLFAASYDGSAVPLGAYSVSDSSWAELGLTWNNRPPLGDLQTSVTVSGTTYAWYELDVTAYLQAEQIAGHTLVTLGLHNTATSPQFLQIRSKEYATIPNRPQLVVSYAP